MSTTALSPDTAVLYAVGVAQLSAVITAYRCAEPGGYEDKTKTDNGRPSACSCGRKIRASNAVIDTRPMICGSRGEAFERKARED